MNGDRESHAGFPGSRWNFVWIGFALVAAFFWMTEHAAHVFGALPYVLLLACPLMHLFGHHGRHGPGANKTECRGDESAAARSEGPRPHSS
ncbi:MAG: DUF2933 domain-containing protein [Burkholderiales bacterium]